MIQDSPGWASPDIPLPQDCVLRDILERRARERPDDLYVMFDDGTSWTYAQALEHARRAASGLAALGLSHGDRLALWMRNGPAFLKFWFGANFLGAIVAAFNTQYRGGILQHLMNLSGARIAVVDADLLEHLDGLDLDTLRTVLAAGDIACPSPLPALDVRPAQPVLDSIANPDALGAVIAPWDTQFIIFTSGTTGPSKGVIMSYVQMQAQCLVHYEGRFNATDRYLVNMPLFHVTGLLPAFAAMLTGGAIVLLRQFQTDSFWDSIRAYHISGCTMVGAVANFLESRRPAPDDADNPLRWVSMFPLVKDPAGFAARFGVDIFTAYGMSELSMPIISEANPADPASCGRLRAGYEARIVDRFDGPVAEGDIGELILRADRPWAITPGYWQDPAATAAAWRNGWFHTGDSFRRDAQGRYYFVDRNKDVIRRRGENISSYEVELEALAHPAIAEVAAIAVPSPHGEDDVMAVAVLAPGTRLDPAELIRFLTPRMARFMLPRYVRIVDQLPRTPTMRVQKHLLRADGVTADTWDRERRDMA